MNTIDDLLILSGLQGSMRFDGADKAAMSQKAASPRRTAYNGRAMMIFPPVFGCKVLMVV